MFWQLLYNSVIIPLGWVGFRILGWINKKAARGIRGRKDLWKKLLKETQKKKMVGKIIWKKVLGHSGHKWNDRCDELATSFARGKRVDLYDGREENYKI